MTEKVIIDYTNHRGTRSLRCVVPAKIWFGETQWHRGKQWLLEAYDEEKEADRHFAMKKIHSWKPA